GTDRALEMRAIVQGGAVIASLADRVLGRTTAEDIVDAKTGEVVIEEGALLDEAMVAQLEEIGLQGVKIRSPLVCASRQGVCAKCYGRDLARGTPVNIGEAVGVVADDTGSKSKKESLHPRLTLTGAKAKEAGVYRLASGAIVAVEDGQLVETGEVLARMPREAARTRDITGGLPRVAELFEARKP